MPMRVNELHPSSIHFPLALLPLAAATDAVAVSRSDPFLDGTGRFLWSAGVAGALVAGVTGFAASQEALPKTEHERDALAVHGLVNLGVTIAGLGFTTWRVRNRPTALSTAIGAAACGLAVYSAWVGGELVYGSGLGIRPADSATEGASSDERNPRVLSARAPFVLARDAVRGALWLGRIAVGLVGARQQVEIPGLRARVGKGQSVPSPRAAWPSGDSHAEPAP